jgi:hypothetical protein
LDLSHWSVITRFKGGVFLDVSLDVGKFRARLDLPTLRLSTWSASDSTRGVP